MKIAINALSAQTGAGVSCFVNLLPQLDKADKKNIYLVILSRYQKEIIESIPEKFEKVVFSFNSRNFFIRILFEQVCLPVWLFLYKIDLLYSVGNITTILAPCKIVLLMENANPYSQLKIKLSLNAGTRLKLIKIFGYLSAKRAEKIRFVSENSGRIFNNLLRIPKNKSVVIPQGVNIPSLTSFDKTENMKYILTVADIYPYKNLHFLMDAFELLVNKYKYDGVLQIVGAPINKNYYQMLIDKKKMLKNGNKIIFTGRIPCNQLEPAYRNAELFVFPSIEETFGIPLIEAMSCGVPVAASDCSSLAGTYFNPFREICGDAAEYFNPYDIDNMSGIMYKIISDEKLRNTLINNGFQQVKKYDWSIVAQQLVEVFNSLEK